MPIVALSTRTLPPNKFRLHPVPMLNLVYHLHRNLILLLFPFPCPFPCPPILLRLQLKNPLITNSNQLQWHLFLLLSIPLPILITVRLHTLPIHTRTLTTLRNSQPRCLLITQDRTV